MTQAEALDRLAAWCGIEPEYHDIWGNPHTTSQETKRALLAAMHLPLDADLQSLADELEAGDWRRPLPPVRVVRARDAELRIEITVAAAIAQQTFQWTLSLENGERMDRQFRPADLEAVAERRIGGALFLRRAFILPAPSLTGYHRLELEQLGQESVRPVQMSLIVAPAVCYQPQAISGEGRVWGPAVQLYGMRSRRNWGIGDFTDLGNLIDLAAECGAGIVGVNPLHGLFPDNPQHCSPYSPSSRLFLNTLYIDVEAVADFRDCKAAQDLYAAPRFQASLRRLRTSELVEYQGVAAAKMEVLELAYSHFREHHLNRDTERGRAFDHFRAQQGLALARQALFEALQAHFRKQDGNIWGWPVWPEAYRDQASPEVAAFAEANAAQVEFYSYLQWLADEQVAAVGLRSRARKLGVGIYRDLALGVSPGGAEAWANLGIYAVDAHAGAPPDDFNLYGQDWGLPPFIPHRLREAAYAPFIATLRANMRHCGALRIDHVMSLMRLYWVPAGASAAAGAYVSYPLDDLLGILALESQRNRCMVIGEDLGTVPDALRPALAALSVLSYRPFFFERSNDGGFKPPAAYPRQALVTIGTHDLPTLRGFWKGSDLDARAALGLFPTPALRESAVVSRSQDRARLLMALQREALLPAGASVQPVAVPEITAELALAVHVYLARTPAQIMAIQPEDIFGVIEQVNLPGSTEGHPNWRRKLPLDLEEWGKDERLRALTDALRQERGSAVAPQREETTG